MDPEQALSRWGPRLLTIGVAATFLYFLLLMGVNLTFYDWLDFIIRPLIDIGFEMVFSGMGDDDSCGACLAGIATICYAIYATLKWFVWRTGVLVIDVAEAVGIDIDGDGDLSGYDGERKGLDEVISEAFAKQDEEAGEKTESALCLGRRADGARCLSKVKDGGYCFYHQDQDPSDPLNIARWAAEAKENTDTEND